MSERLIVIGGGGAGTAAATIAKRVNPDLKVTLFTEFPDIAYSPCGIPFVHGREIPEFENLFLSTVERYIEDGLDMRMETDGHRHRPRPRRTVTARNKHEGFDKLIVCTGFVVGEARRARAPTSRGCTTSRTSARAMEFDKELDVDEARRRDRRRRRSASRWPARSAHRGLHVDFIDEGPWLLSELLDPDVAEPVHEALEKLGVNVRLGTKRRGLRRRRTDACARSPRPRASSSATRVIVCLHKLPNTALAEAAGLKIGTTGGGRRSTTTCARRRRTCGRPATWSRCRTGSRCSRSAG